MLALGAAIGRPDSVISYSASGWLGLRIPIHPVYAVKHIGSDGPLGVTNVSGPGQKAYARRLYKLSSSASCRSMSDKA